MGDAPLTLELATPWLIARLGSPHRVLSWAVHRPGLVETDTVGRSNACLIADPRGVRPWKPGTIDLLARVSVPLAEPALLEALSIATEARTAALLADPWHGPDGRSPITGTGQALGAAVHAATRVAVREWLEPESVTSARRAGAWRWSCVRAATTARAKPTTRWSGCCRAPQRSLRRPCWYARIRVSTRRGCC